MLSQPNRMNNVLDSIIYFYSIKMEKILIIWIKINMKNIRPHLVSPTLYKRQLNQL